MPTDNQEPANSSPGSPVVVTGGGKGKQKINFKTIALIIGVFVLLGGVVTGYFLLQQNQDIREKAVEQCSVSYCPQDDDPTRLLNCNPPDLDGSWQISTCDEAGRIEECDLVEYCCPYTGGSWTSDLTQCVLPTATATATAAPTATATGSASASPTPTSTGVKTPTPTAALGGTTSTPVPIPESGIETPTVIGIGIGALLLLVSLALAL